MIKIISYQPGKLRLLVNGRVIEVYGRDSELRRLIQALREVKNDQLFRHR